MNQILKEIERRRTFGIISHPDAGKTTITEKLLLFGNAIHIAGMVRAKRGKNFATSDWMEIEKQRGISVASSVMQFNYHDFAINLLDTPGHADFSEDTYRVLTAVDSALMVIDASKGIEARTRKLFEVCRSRHIPIVTFMNKMDLEGWDPFDLVDQIEKELQMQCAVMTWPIGQGKRFRGVYDLRQNNIRLFDPNAKTTDFEQQVFDDVTDPQFIAAVGENAATKLAEDLELLEGAGHGYDEEAFLAGQLSPVFFGSALNNFGVQELLEAFTGLAPAPGPRAAQTRDVLPTEEKFSALVFKIQANMDPKHRDRIAFMRVCSGTFRQGMSAYHVRNGRQFKIGNAVQFMSQRREQVEEAFAGDIIGVHDRGNLIIGDTITEGEKLQFTGVPLFAPELFSLVVLKNPIKMKQLQKGLDQLSEEGASQVFRRKYNSDSIVGVVGQLQFEVVKYRLQHEYGAEAIFEPMGFTASRWYHCADEKQMEEFENYYRSQVVYDVRGYPMILFKSDWEEGYIQEKYPSIQFYGSLAQYEQALL